MRAPITVTIRSGYHKALWKTRNARRMDESRIRPKSGVGTIAAIILISCYYYIIMHRAWFISRAGPVRWWRQLPFIPTQGSSSCRRRGFHGDPRYSVANSPFHRAHSLTGVGGPARPWCAHAHYTYVYNIHMYNVHCTSTNKRSCRKNITARKR